MGHLFKTNQPNGDYLREMCVEDIIPYSPSNSGILLTCLEMSEKCWHLYHILHGYVGPTTANMLQVMGTLHLLNGLIEFFPHLVSQSANNDDLLGFIQIKC